MRTLLCSLFTLALAAGALAEPVPLFDGKTFEGWVGDTQKTWRVQDGMIVGGSLTEKTPRNEFLATKKSYKNFDLKLKFKLVGTEGFVNSGLQFRSVRIPNPPNEMSGYQADLGDPTWWGSLYDESRRNKVVAQSDMAAIEPVLKRQDWNEYRVRAVGRRIQVWLNGVQTVDYTEPDEAIPQEGSIAVQVHGGGKTEVSFKDMMIEELPADAAPGPGAAPSAEPKRPASAAATNAPAKTAGAEGARDISYNAVDTGARTAEEERASFHLPEGFVAELVADESVMAKAVAFNFDTAGRMWVTTASEYPLDANEQPEAAARLYREGGKDAVLIFDTPWAAGLQRPRVFAGVTAISTQTAPSNQSAIRDPQSEIRLAMPMGVLPYKDGAIIQHGPDLLFLRDTDGDGRADTKEVLLTGFGIQDSHLMPHGFTRGPGDWIYFAQGAFNTSVVKTKEGPEVTAKHCKLMRMKPDGSHFEVVGWGLNNIWGFVIDPRGEMWVQEANDMGYPVAPFQIGMAYPGIGNDKPRPYAPFMPPPTKLNDCTMGGTGLSGLALSEDAETWPAPWTGAFMVANPITNRIQAIRVHSAGVGRVSPRAGDGASSPDAIVQTAPVPTRGDTRPTPSGYDDVTLEKLPDFLVSDDKMFRPVAIQFGPDGSLYVIDWYNKIISHNEVPRTHPDRDKTRTRIWRIRATNAAKRGAPNLQKETPDQLIKQLSSANQWEANGARFELIDRGNVEEFGDDTQEPLGENNLHRIARDRTRKLPNRLQALWALSTEGSLSFETPIALVKELDPSLLREMIRALRLDLTWSAFEVADDFGGLVNDANPGIRAALIQQLGPQFPTENDDQWLALQTLLRCAGPPVEASPDRAFTRYLVRLALENARAAVQQFLGTKEAKKISAEACALIALSMEPVEGARRFVEALPALNRPLISEEFALLSTQLGQPVVRAAFTRILTDPAQQAAVLAAIEKLPPDVLSSTGKDAVSRVAEAASPSSKIGNAGAGSAAADVRVLIANAARDLLQRSPTEANRQLVLRLAKVHRLVALEPEVVSYITTDACKATDQIEGVKALREMGAARVDLFFKLSTARTGTAQENEQLHREAVTALAGASSAEVIPMLAQLWPQLAPALRKLALDNLTSSKVRSTELVKLVRANGAIGIDDLDETALEKLVTVLGPDQPDLAALLNEIKGAIQPVLRLTGNKSDMVETKLALVGPFTAEAWVKLDAGISNEDVLLGSPSGPNFNFYDGRLRVFVGAPIHDALIAKTPMPADMWTHVAVTRDDAGQFRIYLNGELNAEGGKPWKESFTAMDIGRSTLPKGTGMSLTEMRVWNTARTAEEIRNNYQRSIAGEALPPGIQFAITATPESAQTMSFFPSAPKLAGEAKVVRTRDFPELLTGAAARALDAKFAQYRSIVAQPGKSEHGRALFAGTCAACHRVKGEGGQIGPDLSGVGAMGIEALLRNVLTPNAQLESGYYRFDVELRSGDLLTGFLVKDEPDKVIVRQLTGDERTIPRSEIRRTKISRRSLMPEGLLDGMAHTDVADLFGYLQTLK